MTEHDRPLVTIALFAYNQERFIREAVEGVLGQDYEPLEIILSDDCSADETFAIIKNMVKEYAGSNKVILNRNENNLGICPHVSKIMSIASGDLIIVASGDDISLPGRTSTLVESWLSSNREPDLLCSDYFLINESGAMLRVGKGCKLENMTPVRIAEHGFSVLGATAAWTKSLWLRFPEIPAPVVHEDQIMSFRAAMAGGIKYIEMPLVRYRYEVSTWIARGRTMDPSEMQARTAKISYNQMLVSIVQLTDAVCGKRLDLLPLINSRFNMHRMVFMIYGGQLNFASAVLQSIRHGTVEKRLLKALVQAYFPWLHGYMLRARNKFAHIGKRMKPQEMNER